MYGRKAMGATLCMAGVWPRLKIASPLHSSPERPCEESGCGESGCWESDCAIRASYNTVHLRTFWWYSVLGAKASPRGHLMNVTIVESTSLATVAYDDARKLLQLEFCSRAIYQYFGVPAAVHAALLRAPPRASTSIGSFVDASPMLWSGVPRQPYRMRRAGRSAHDRRPHMARTVASLPAGSRITDYISLGVLTKAFPLDKVM